MARSVRVSSCRISEAVWRYKIVPVVLLLAGGLMTGCGGGGSSNRLSRKTARERAIASARLTRGVFAVAGIGRRITRSAKINQPRLRLVLVAVTRTRDTPPDLDPDTGLYFVVRTDLDGSGEQDLFVDAAHQQAAGAFVWQAPVWANGQKNTYPAQIHTDYQITAGEFAGEHGTIDFTASDSTGDNGSMHVVMTTHENERVVADFDIRDGQVSAKAHCTLPDETSYDEVDIPAPDGGMTCTIDFPDGSQEILNMEPDGTSTEKLTDPDGTVEAQGNIQEDGTDTLTLGDGSTESDDVDTADAGDGGGSGDTSGSDSSGDGSDRHRAVRKGTRS